MARQKKGNAPLGNGEIVVVSNPLPENTYFRGLRGLTRNPYEDNRGQWVWVEFLPGSTDIEGRRIPSFRFRVLEVERSNGKA